jgi:hypothetical protein
LLYKIKQKEIRKKYEEEVTNIIENNKYQIQKIESFAEFQDELNLFMDCGAGFGSRIIPISFSECEQHCKLLGKDALSYYKNIYDKAKYKWAKKHCVSETLTQDDVSLMLKDIQTATLPFGSFSIAFKTHRLNNNAVPSYYDKKMVYYAPLLYDMDDIQIDISDYMCDVRANCMFNEKSQYHQMHIYTDNILSKKDVDNIYPLICELVKKYNEYATETYNIFKNDKSYQHREDFDN